MTKDSDKTLTDKPTDEEEQRKAARDRRLNPADRRGTDRVSSTSERREDEERRGSD